MTLYLTLLKSVQLTKTSSACISTVPTLPQSVPCWIKVHVIQGTRQGYTCLWSSQPFACEFLKQVVPLIRSTGTLVGCRNWRSANYKVFYTVSVFRHWSVCPRHLNKWAITKPHCGSWANYCCYVSNEIWSSTVGKHIFGTRSRIVSAQGTCMLWSALGKIINI